jgi:hypothetical protein
MNLILILRILAAGVILVHCMCIVAKLSPRNWFGHRLQFFGLSAAYALIAGGAVGSAFSWHLAPTLLLLGIAGLVLFDRRIRL